MIPDFVVKDPLLAPVWEITGAEFSKSKIHTALDLSGKSGISIRFPRCTRLREDKTAKEATTLPELQCLCRF